MIQYHAGRHRASFGEAEDAETLNYALNPDLRYETSGDAAAPEVAASPEQAEAERQLHSLLCRQLFERAIAAEKARKVAEAAALKKDAARHRAQTRRGETPISLM